MKPRLPPRLPCAGGLDIRIIPLMLGQADIKTSQRYLNITEQDLRKALTGGWERRRQLKAVGEYHPAPLRSATAVKPEFHHM